MTNILIIVADYASKHSVGSERIRKFKKYLPEFGYQPFILTTDAALSGRPTSESNVFHSFELGNLYRPLMDRFDVSGHVSPASARRKLSNQDSSSHDTLMEKRFGQIRQWMIDNVMIPDVRIGWFPGAVWTGLGTIRRENIDLILSSSYPNSVHLIAGSLAALSRRPWVADFRDGWIFESLNPALRKEGLRRHVEQKLESWVVANADAIVTVSRPLSNYFRTSYSSEKHKIHTLTNGYDPADWDGLIPIARDSTEFWLVHTGSFGRSSATRSLEPILRALCRVNPHVRSNLRLVLVGTLTKAESLMLEEYGLSEIARKIGHVSRSKSLAYQLAADCLLLMVGKDVSVATSKLYEYLYSKKPILTIGTNTSAASQIVSTAKAGVVVHPDQPQAIADQLTTWHAKWERDALISESEGIGHFERRVLARELTKIIGVTLSRRREVERVPVRMDT